MLQGTAHPFRAKPHWATPLLTAAGAQAGSKLFRGLAGALRSLWPRGKARLRINLVSIAFALGGLLMKALRQGWRTDDLSHRYPPPRYRS